MSEDRKPRSMSLVTRGGERVNETGGDAETTNPSSKPRKPVKIAVPRGMALKPEAAREYKRIVKELQQRQKYDARFEKTIGTYAWAYAEWLEAKSETAKEGAVYTGPNGGFVYNPWAARETQMATLMVSLGKEFGLTTLTAIKADSGQLDLFGTSQARGDTDEPNPYSKVGA